MTRRCIHCERQSLPTKVPLCQFHYLALMWGIEWAWEARNYLNQLVERAETGEQWAEICRIEAELEGGPFFDGTALETGDGK